jgi:hypothetical protein
MCVKVVVAEQPEVDVGDGGGSRGDDSHESRHDQPFAHAHFASSILLAARRDCLHAHAGREHRPRSAEAIASMLPRRDDGTTVVFSAAVRLEGKCHA